MADEGKALGQLVRDLQQEYGEHHYGRLDLHLSNEVKDEAMRRASAKPAMIGSFNVQKVETLDGVKFFLDAPTYGNGAEAWVLVRASGTEPLLRIYCEAASPELVSQILKETESFVGAGTHAAAPVLSEAGERSNSGGKGVLLCGAFPPAFLAYWNQALGPICSPDSDWMATTSNPQPADSPEVRRYNRIQRWLSMADAVIGFALLVVLLVTGWTGKLRDWSYLGAHQYYFLAVFLYVLMFSVIAKILSAPFDFVGFRLERQYHLSNQKMRGWLWDECKGWLVGLVLGAIMVEIVYAIIRIAPQRWWIIAWAVFVGLFLLMAQLAPVVLMPIFYKFQPLDNDGLRERLTKLGERAGTRVRGVYEWKLSEKSEKANAALTGMGATRRIILSDTLLQHYSDDEIEAVLAHELGHHVHRHILKGIFMQVGITFFGFWLVNQVLRFVIAKDWFPVLTARLYDFANLPLIVLVATVLGISADAGV